MTKFYVITTEYLGPDIQQHLNEDTVKISKKPAVSPITGEPRLEGPLVMINDWRTTAHGEFESLEDARAKVYELYGDDVRLIKPLGVSEIYRIGRLLDLGKSGAEQWMDFGACIGGSCTDGDIEKDIERAERELAKFGLKLDTDHLSTLEFAKRNWLRGSDS